MLQVQQENLHEKVEEIILQAAVQKEAKNNKPDGIFRKPKTNFRNYK